MKLYNRMMCIITILSAISTTVFATDRHLETGAYLTTTTVLDDSFEFFSDDTMVLDSWGLDVRAELWNVNGTLHLLPVVSYRYANVGGSPHLPAGLMNTSLILNEVDAGLRGRVWFLPWLGGFAQLQTGISHIAMEGVINNAGQEGMYNKYRDKDVEWNIGALMGLEIRISPWRMERAHIDWLNIGAEIGVGFIKRTEANFSPTLKGGDELSLTNIQTVDFGNIDLSGIVFQAGLTASFL